VSVPLAEGRIVRIERWKHGKRWVYSTTYDEVPTSVVENALPIHRMLAVPGHLTVVVGQLGQPRDVPGSGYDATYTHVSVAECKLVQRYGWTVSSHSMTHNKLPGGMAVPANARLEVVESQRLLERLLGTPVTAFFAPGNDLCLPYAWPLAEEAGYLSMFGVRDQLNYPESDLMQLCRPVLYHRLDEYQRAYDPYRLIYAAQESGGWLVDYTHAVQDELVIPNRELTPAELATRLETVTRVGRDEVWLAVPEEVVDYLIMSRQVSIVDLNQTSHAVTFRVSAPNVPARVQWRALTFLCTTPAHWEEVIVKASSNGQSEVLSPERLDATTVRFTHRVYDGQYYEVAARTPSL
jgi:hypothetical protein